MVDARSRLCCPQCKSADVAALTNPKSGRPAALLGIQLMRCGVCGHDFSVETSELLDASALAQPGAAIERDAPCNKCGYNLRGLRIGDKCPECGTPIVLVPSVRYVEFTSPKSESSWPLSAYL